MDIDATNQEVTKIGSMNWSKRNLDVSILNGNEIPYASSTEAIKKIRENQQPCWCFYDNNP